MPIKGILGGAGVKPLGYGLGVETEVKDANFNETTLLLHGDGTDGGQNNTFTDSSSNNASITRLGNTTQGTFSPFSVEDGYWSIATTTAGNISLGSRVFSNLSGDKSWTIEGWVYFPDIGNAYTNLISAYTSGQVNSVAIFLRGSGQSYEPSSISLATYGGSNITFLNPGSNSIPHSEWFHFAFVRDSSNGNGYCFINGVLEQTVSFSATSFYDVDNKMNDVSSQSYHFSNFRIVDGTAVYTSAFTPSTAPLTAITNTTFLMGQSNRFIDNSSSPVTITPNSAGAKIQPFSPFAPSRSYSEDAVGGSGFFDGTDDYLKIASNLSTELTFGTGDFDLSVWLYPTISTGSRGVYEGRPGGNGVYPFMRLDGLTPKYGVDLAGSPVNVNGSTDCQLNAWNFVTWSRVSGTTRIFLNGTQIGSATDTKDLLSPGTGDYPYIGAGYAPGDYFPGFMCNYRVRKGVGVTSQTVPTTLLTNDGNTQLLLDFTNASIIDNTMKNNLDTVGNTRIRTDIKKYGTGSIYFDGTGDVLVQEAGPLTFYFGYGEFTIEFWCQIPSGAATTSLQMFMSSEGGSWSSGAISYYTIYTAGVGNYVFPFYVHDYHASSPMLNAVDDLRDGNWHHHAIVRGTSGACAYFVDGTRKSTATHTGLVGSSTRDMKFGGIDTSSRNAEFFLDDLRVTIGVARYDPSQSSVTIPTQAFPNR